MSKFKKFWSKIGNFLSKLFSFIIEVASSVEPTWTKESSYALIVCIDTKNDTYPQRAVDYMSEIFSECASNVNIITNNDATVDAILNAMEEGVKYKTFYFYIFAHGLKRSLSVADKKYISSKQIWNVLRKSNDRIIGFFDACYSGSMISDPEEIIKSKDNESGSIADDIIKMFEEQELHARSNGNEESIPKTSLKLYSASSPDTSSLYIPKKSSMYSDAIHKTYMETDNKTYREFDEKLIKNGTLHVLNNPNYEWIIPQVSSYGKDFSSYIRLR